MRREILRSLFVVPFVPLFIAFVTTPALAQPGVVDPIPGTDPQPDLPSGEAADEVPETADEADSEETDDEEAEAAAPTDAAAADDRTFTFVIIHGAWGGGWAFKEVDRLLSDAGHTVYRPTLTGQGERVHLANPDIDLDLHIQDVVNVLEWEELEDVVLVGHSYGGMVVTGAADRAHERIGHLVYLDAFLPNDGESLDGGTPRPAENGFVMLGNMDLDAPPPHDVPHPAKTLSQPIEIQNPDELYALTTTYILTVDAGREPERDGFYRHYQRAGERGWPRVIMEGDHNVQWSKPRELAELLQKVARGQWKAE